MIETEECAYPANTPGRKSHVGKSFDNLKPSDLGAEHDVTVEQDAIPVKTPMSKTRAKSIPSLNKDTNKEDPPTEAKGDRITTEESKKEI